VNSGLRSLVVDVADNTTGTPEEVSHQRIRFAAYGIYPSGTMTTDNVTLAANRLYEITATPNGPRGMSCTVTDQFDVKAPPVAMFTYTVDGATVSFDASGSDDTDGVIVSWEWDFGDGSSGTGETTTHTYAMTDIYTVILTVTDNDGLWDTDTQSVDVTVPNQPPVARFSYTTDMLTVNVDGSASSDSDGMIMSWDWLWGDGMTGSGEMASHTYAAADTYPVRLTVTDDDGATNSLTQMVTVDVNEPPVAAFTYTISLLTVNVDASTSYDPEMGPLGYAWAWGDGTTGSGVTASHTYANGGTFTIVLTVTDDQGATDTASATVNLNTPPTAAFTYSVEARTVSVDGSASHDAEGAIVSWAWNFGDGSMGTGDMTTHTYVMDGTYPVTLTVTDAGGLTASISHDVSITDLPPTASFTFSVSGMTVSVDAFGSSDDWGIDSYAWNWGDGTTGSGMTASHTYSAPGSLAPSMDEPSVKARPPGPPYNVIGYVYDPSGIVVPGAPVVITNTRTGGTGSTVADSAGFYIYDLNFIPGDWRTGDLIRVSVDYNGMTGFNEAYGVENGPGLFLDIHLEGGAEPIEMTVTLTVTDASGQTATVSQVVTLQP